MPAVNVLERNNKFILIQNWFSVYKFKNKILSNLTSVYFRNYYISPTLSQKNKNKNKTTAKIFFRYYIFSRYFPIKFCKSLFSAFLFDLFHLGDTYVRNHFFVSTWRKNEMNRKICIKAKIFWTCGVPQKKKKKHILWRW